jgi:hypothetical protein
MHVHGGPQKAFDLSLIVLGSIGLNLRSLLYAHGAAPLRQKPELHDLRFQVSGSKFGHNALAHSRPQGHSC